jgi:hypothetical protein
MMFSDPPWSKALKKLLQFMARCLKKVFWRVRGRAGQEIVEKNVSFATQERCYIQLEMVLLLARPTQQPTDGGVKAETL